MYIRFFLFCFFLLSYFVGNSADISIFPTPQKVIFTGKTFSLEGTFWIKEKNTDPYLRQLLSEILPLQKEKKGRSPRIYIGQIKDPQIKKFRAQIPEISGGYYLSVRPETIIIAGFDQRGLFYALQTLRQLRQGNRLAEADITDFPTVLYRGVVEGFYGQPWSHEDRLRQLRFYGNFKLNTYIYGPKDDPYQSSPNWRIPYPEKEARQISTLVEEAKANQVDFIWAIHPGQDIQWNDADRQALLKKFEDMYRLGVRSFAVFFDDISGEGTDPVRQAELLNFLHDRFVAAKPDVTPLIMCPTEYNKSWSNPKPGSYLDILGENLYPSILVMWTGDRVISDITASGLEEVNQRIRRPAYVWWNFPVNDYVRDHLLMGPAYGLDASAGKKMSGFVANPMEKAEASKIAIFGVADYAWNPAKYDSGKAWEKAIQVLMPNASEALHTFAAHNSDLGPNGHKYRREESVNINPEIRKFLTAFRKGDMPAESLSKIRTEYQKILTACTQLSTTPENPDLIREISPWLMQFEVLGKAGLAATELAALSPRQELCRYWDTYSALIGYENERLRIDKSYNQNPYQPGIKTGSLVMQPFIDSVRLLSEQLFWKEETEPAPKEASVPRLYTNIEQIKSLPLQKDSNRISLTPMLEVIRIAPQQYLGIAFPYPMHSAQLEANLNASVSKWGRLEISANGSDWIPCRVTPQGTVFTAALPDSIPFQYVRFINFGPAQKEIYLKKYSLSSPLLSELKNSVAFLSDKQLQTACILMPAQSAVIENPHKGVNKRYCLLTILPPQAALEIKGKTKDNQFPFLGTADKNCYTFECPAEIEEIHISNPTQQPISLYELLEK